MADNTLSEYDQDFADAMALKLRLSREKKQKASEVSKPVSEPSDTKEEMIFDRSEIIASAQKRHPGLTKETAEQMMDELGF
ncbi:hypothetical protein OAQ47_01830 [Paracoccaceae bacterium]|nr:hypothetical protein [Paracoccaceae bacterium]